MAISQELENAIRGSIHSASGALELIDLCNASPLAGSNVEQVATSATIGTALIAALTVTNISGGSASLTGRISVPSITCTDIKAAGTISAATANITSSLAAKSILATNISAGTGLTCLNIIGTDIVAAGTISAASGNFTSDLFAKSALVTSLSAANATVGTNITVGSVMSAASGNIQSNLTAKSVAATTVNVASAQILAGSLHVLGGTAANTTQAVLFSHPVNYVSVSDASKNYFALPAVTAGACRDVINCLNSTAGLIAVGSVSINGATSQILATNGAVGGSYALICDGTSWWKRAT